MFGHMKDPADGTATLVSYVETNAGNEFDRVVIAQVVVQAEGLQPTAVEWTVGVPTSSLPLDAGHVWPVRVDRANPQHLKLDDDKLAAEGEAARTAGRAEAERLAQQLRDQPSS